jgi:hypothetical protein
VVARKSDVAFHTCMTSSVSYAHAIHINTERQETDYKTLGDLKKLPMGNSSVLILKNLTK